MTRIYQFTATFLSLVLFTLISGCSILPQPETITSYQLLPLQTTSNDQAPLPTTLRINKPHASGLLTNSRILIQPDDYQLQVYKGVQWHETTPTLIQNHLFDAFNQAQIIEFVYKDSHPQIKTTYELDSDLRSYQVIKKHTKTLIRLQLAARILDSKPKTILAAKIFTQEMEINSLEINQLITNFSLAQNQLTQEVLNWTQETLAR